MASFLQLFTILCVLFPFISCMASNEKLKPYIVYMGSSSKGNEASAEAAELYHLQLLSSIDPSGEKGKMSLLHSYHHAFRGFSAMLTEDEASLLSGHDEVVSVFPDQRLELHTTRSWDFLGGGSNLRSNFPYERMSSDVIIGVIDTGIWPESPSFDDRNIGEIPKRWKGVCMGSSDFNKSNCNRKLIGARFYHMQHTSAQTNATEPNRPGGSPRDSVGHGTHTASIAAGVPVANASYYGLAKGRARGGLPSARIASYKACVLGLCDGSTILKAIHDAIVDGVDVISISIGLAANSILQSDFLNDPIAIGAFHAEQNGVMVVCSCGNDGPAAYTVVNSAPWIFTIAASNIDRNFESTVLLGNGKSFKGTAINFSNLTSSKTYPLAFAAAVASPFTPASEARNCRPGSLDFTKVAGKIIVCVNEDLSVSRRIKKLVVEDAKAKGLIVISDEGIIFPFDSGDFPYAEIGMSTAGSQILKYINSTKRPTATILPATEVRRFKPAPIVAPFSSRGPGMITENILKPDIMAPGVAILAAVPVSVELSGTRPGMKPPSFGIKSGTSMACPHVSGAMAFIKSMRHEWSSSMIKSALMTTATMFNNMGKPLTNSWEQIANPHDTGAGEISPTKALDPGLIFETNMEDYLSFLCYHGYEEKIIRSMSNTNFNCPRKATKELISSMNYPSISIAKLNRTQDAIKVNRVVTNVGSPNANYVSSIHAPQGLVVSVHPKRIIFSQGLKKASFEVSFDGREALKGYNFGVVTWFDGSHMVRLVFAVNIE